MSQIAAQRAVARIKATTQAHLAASPPLNAPPTQTASGRGLYGEISRLFNGTTPASNTVDVTS